MASGWDLPDLLAGLVLDLDFLDDLDAGPVAAEDEAVLGVGCGRGLYASDGS